MKIQIKSGSTSQRVFIFVQDSSQIDGRGLTGLVYNSSGLIWYTARDDDGNAGGTAVTLASATRGTFTSGGFKEKDATNMPGIYEIGIPNVALASGSKSSVMMLSGAANMAPVLLEIELVLYDPYDASLGILDLANGVETSWTLRQSLRIMFSALAGKASGLGGTTVTYRNVGDTKDRIVATVDSDGDRSAVTLDGT